MNTTILLSLLMSFQVVITAKNPYAVQNIDPLLLTYAHEVIRLETTELEVVDFSKSIYRSTLVKTIIKNDNKEYFVDLPYNAERKIKKLDLVVYDGYGEEIRTYKSKDFRDISTISISSIYEDSRTKYIDLRSFKKPFTYKITYELVLTGLNHINLPNWQPQEYDTSIEFASYKVILPENQGMNTRELNGIKPAEITFENGKRRYFWSISNTVAIPAEPYSPDPTEVLPTLWISSDQFTVNKINGSMSSWTSFGNFIHTLFEGRQQLSEETKREVQSIKTTSTGDADLVSKLFQYMSSKTRYVSVQLGIGGWQPYDAAYVERNKYGDCKALTNFMMALLKEANITSYPVVTYQGDSAPNVAKDFTMAAFNHMILYVPDLDWWLDCTSNLKPYEYPGRQNMNRFALVVKPDQSELAFIEPYEPLQIPIQQDVNVKIVDEKNVHLTATIKLEGYDHELFRYLSTQTEEDQRKYILQRLRHVPEELINFEIVVDDIRPECTLQLELTYNNLINNSGNLYFLPLNPLSEIRYIPSQDMDRIQPIKWAHSTDKVETIRIEIPNQFYIDANQKSGEETLYSKYGSFNMKWSTEGNMLTIERRVQIDSGTYAPGEYIDWRNFMIDLSKKETFNILIKKT